MEVRAVVYFIVKRIHPIFLSQSEKVNTKIETKIEVPEAAPSPAYVGRKLEIRWTVVDDDTGREYLHCFEGEVLEVIPHDEARGRIGDISSRCRHPIAKVKWDPEFKMIDSYVPLNDALYAKENRHCGWNLIKDEFLEFICTKIAECDRAGAGAAAAAKK